MVYLKINSLSILYIAKSSDEVLGSKLEPVLESKYVKKVFLIRDKPYPSKSEKLDQIIICNKNKYLKIAKKIVVSLKTILKYEITYIVSVHLHPHGFIGFFLSALTGVKQIHLINAGEREIWYGGRVIKLINLFVIKRISTLIVQGDNTKRYLIKNGIIESRIKVIPNSLLDYEKPNSLENFRHVDFVTVSRLVKNKKTKQLLECIDFVASKINKEIIINVIGDGPELQNLKNWYEYKPLSPMKVNFLGMVSNCLIRDYYESSRFFALITEGEGVPRSMLESMAYGCIPFVSNVGDISDYITDNENGFLININTNETIVNKLFQLLNLNIAETTRISKGVYQSSITVSELQIIEKYNDVFKT